MNDLRFAFRQLRKSPGFTIVAVLTLALGIGANSAIFSVVNHVLLRPLPYPHPERLVYLSETTGGTNTAIALPDYLDWRNDSKSFEHLALSRLESRNLSGIAGREPERIAVAYVTANFFNVIGLLPQIGRTFTEDEDKPGAPSLAVISDRLWDRAFHRDPNIVGRPIEFHGTPITVVGVMPREMDSPHGVDAWFALMRRANVPGWQNRANHPMFFGWGRLKDGVTVEQARGEIKAISARIEKLYPATNAGVGADVRPLLDNLLGNYRTSLALLLGAVALVLLIACANLANLLAVRGAARAREFAVRAAMGAGRGQIVRQLLLESFVIAAIGGGLGLVFATWGRDALVAFAPAGAPRFEGLGFDWRVMAFTFLLATLTTILFGLWPAWQAARTDINVALQAGSHGSSETKSARRSRDWLVIVEVALTLLLLSAAGLVLKSFAKMQSTQLGFDPQGMLTARIELPFTKYTALPPILNFTTTLLDEVRKLPGVQSAAFAANPPMLSGWQINFQPEGAPPTDQSQQPAADYEVVQGDYFAALRTNLIRGRTFNEGDRADSPPVVIIDQMLADMTFKGQDPLGKRLMVDTESDVVPGGARLYEIVGVVPHLKMRGFDDSTPTPGLFFAQTQVGRTGLTLLVRSSGNVKRLEKPIREIVTRLDPAQPVYDVRPMEERVAETWATQRLLTFLLTIFAGLALLLAAVGLYGVLAYSAARRFREIAVRLALGARPAHIRGLVMGHGLRLFGVGILIGAVAVAASASLIRSFLFGVSPLDPATYLIVGFILSIITVLAAWLPARRACRVNPITALRAE
ncbi:MAG TPA: ABC transporter permease [Chthoniobacterales bacterium]|jgi:putative ABC transport system permease protein|nr:ABC transporter permease [Chthoniobacterales bacterium]